MSTLTINTPRVFLPLLKPVRYKGAKGGRGSGKSHHFAEAVIEAHMLSKTDTVCLRETMKSLKFSSKKLLEGKIEALGVGYFFEVQESCIKDKNGGIIIFQGMQDHTAESIKSLEGFKIAWFAEAQSASQRSLDLLRPTMRTGSELWFDWNPFKEDDPIELLFNMLAASNSTDYVLVEANWKDNPWFPEDLKKEMAIDASGDQDKFDHIWNGKFLRNSEGDYYKHELSEVRKTNRICNIPNMDLPVNTFWDIGNSDGCAVWFHQQVGLEDRFIGYYEAHGETLAHYAKELKSRGYNYNKHFFPHDADHKRLSDTNKSVKEMMADQGLQNIEIIPVITSLNTGIQITKKHFPSAYFDEIACKDGIKRLENYRKRYNKADNRWMDEPNKANGCSEAADAFRQWAQAKDVGVIVTAGNWSNTLNYPKVSRA
jgi:phage terminase large subunit